MKPEFQCVRPEDGERFPARPEQHEFAAQGRVERRTALPEEAVENESLGEWVCGGDGWEAHIWSCVSWTRWDQQAGAFRPGWDEVVVA